MTRIVRDDVDKFFTYGIEMSSKTIYLNPSVDVDFAAYAICALRVLENHSPSKPITIIMNNYGGEIYDGMAVYDYIEKVKEKTEVNIEVYGACMSMGAWVLQAGTTRKMSKHARLMIHDGYSEYPSDNPNTIKKWHDFYWNVDVPELNDLMLKRIREKKKNFSQKKFEEMLKFDTIFTAKKALEYGLIDEII